MFYKRFWVNIDFQQRVKYFKLNPNCYLRKNNSDKFCKFCLKCPFSQPLPSWEEEQACHKSTQSRNAI